MNRTVQTRLRSPRRRRGAGCCAACGGSSSSSGGGGAVAGPEPTTTCICRSCRTRASRRTRTSTTPGQGLILTTNTYEGLLTYKAGTATPTLEPALATELDGVGGQQGLHLQAAPGRDVPRRDAVHLGCRQAVLRPAPGGQPGPGLHGSDVASVVTQGDYKVTITLKDATPRSSPTWPRRTARR